MAEILTSHKNGYVEVIAEENGQQIGRTVSINIGRTAFLEEFHVNRSCREQGVGSKLIDQAEKTAAEDGAVRMVRIGFFCDTPSIQEYIQTTKFLTRRGFRSFGVLLSKRLSNNGQAPNFWGDTGQFGSNIFKCYNQDGENRQDTRG